MLAAALAVLLLGVAIGWAVHGGSSTTAAGNKPSTSSASSASATSRPATTTTQPPRSTAPRPGTTLPSGCDAVNGADTVAAGDLPKEAIETLDLIASDGPFPFHQDGVVFQNREKLLPTRGKGYYHEYTVVTPRSSDRGARRIIVGKCGEQWYTEDHYVSFRLIELVS